MIRPIACKRVFRLVALYAALTCAARAQTFTTLFEFHDSDGAEPSTGSLTQGLDGNFWGTSNGGGTNNRGTIYKVTPGGVVTTIYSFCSQLNCVDGWDVPSELTLGNDGNFYGTTAAGGTNNFGTIFKVTSNGEYSVIYSFSDEDGADPEGGLVQGADGNLYGTTYEGGNLNCSSPRGCGAVFRVSTKGVLTVLHKFDKDDGENPESGLVQGENGNFYGTTVYGGGNRNGTIFRISRSGQLKRLHSFGYGSDGWRPYAGLIQGSDGAFYGTTYYGGNSSACLYGCGTIYKVSPGAYSTLYAFQLVDGAHPTSGVIQATDGNLYGTTTGGGAGTSCTFYPDGTCGTTFTSTSSGVLQTLHSFNFTDGAAPNGVFQATIGYIYGTTFSGGYTGNQFCSSGCGTIYSIDLGIPPFIGLVRASGRVGQENGVLGQSLSAAFAVSFNGVAAQFKVISDSLLKVQVPPGATTGYVTVTTPTRTLTSNKKFVVLP